ncbi:hypothetical protein SAMN02745866_02958 [Alteromonadaceae bacterium Bs31]|nr:hypothetical protein SAMN02745866_02958 [Alteromonadaceae bacterium Bs31]
MMGKCVLCERQALLTFHHLIPRKLHRRNHYRKNYSREELNRGISVCRKCHNGIHDIYDEVSLSRNFSTLEALRNDRAIARHVRWVAKQK